MQLHLRLFFILISANTGLLAPLILKAQTSVGTVQYVSAVDQQIEVKRVLVLDLFDNVSGVYSKPLQKSFFESFSSQKIWDPVQPSEDSSTGLFKSPTPEELEDQPELVQKIGKRNEVQALVSGRISKTSNGIEIKVLLFLVADGKLLLQESVREPITVFETEEVRKKLIQMTLLMQKRMPYQGLILSRRGQEVTVNLGQFHGVKPGQKLTLIQIYKINRHPRFNFMVGVEKVILGEVQVVRTDEYLSVASVVSEREPNIVVAGTKVGVEEFVKTPSPFQDGVAFGENPKSWKPEEKPTLGQISVLLGLGSYSINNTLDVGTANSNQTLVPSLMVAGEMWFDPHWFTNLNLRQSVFRIANAYPGESTPSRLSVSTSIWTLMVGYNFLVQDEFYGPRIRVSLGMGKMSSMVDNSNPTAFTSVAYGGTVLGLGVSYPMPLENQREFVLGGDLSYYWRPTMSESPVYSGEVANNTVTSFDTFGIYRFTRRMGVKGSLNFDLFASNLNNGGSRSNSASSISHNITAFYLGLDYLF